MTKERAHELIEHFAPEKIPVVVAALQRLLDPTAYSLANAPLEDEEISAEEEAAVARPKAETCPPSAKSRSDFIAEFGLTLEDWDRMGDEPLSSYNAGH